MNLVQVPKVEYVPLMKQVPKTSVREVQKQAGDDVFQCFSHLLEVKSRWECLTSSAGRRWSRPGTVKLEAEHGDLYIISHSIYSL